MTYTIVARCPRTGRLGIGITTYSLAVGALCSFVKPNVGVVAPQANLNPHLGPLALNLMEEGLPPERVMQALEASDPVFQYRQVGIVDKDGNAAGFTGGKAKVWAGHVVGKGYVAMGNVLAGEEVVSAMSKAFEESETLDLEERLLRAIEAGRDAGGQKGATGHLAERSAALLVYGKDRLPLGDGWTDLRVDFHDTAVEELRRIYTTFKPYIPYYRQRINEPHKALPQDEWVRRQGLSVAKS